MIQVKKRSLKEMANQAERTQGLTVRLDDVNKLHTVTVNTKSRHS
jgi:hypothetical protein